eukprot:TRINITY_DN29659_c0_g1_i1.p1 TRINITY_DN29659_c0_g1~~TRINITY_DN29659_c0_g1_i1.p1  ORF type:complete len:219 (-),score=46.13 TRINITY_DN29659_c0_g1_i1:575-1231(-)
MSWSPYDNNGGTVLAVAGEDYCIVAADTRMSTGFSILKRDSSKIFEINDKCILATSGFQADMKALQKTLHARHVVYEQQHNEPMSCPAMAQLLANTLYYKRFFPYYTFNILAGLDTEGRGCVYPYDAIGSTHRTGHFVLGSGQMQVVPVLDNQLQVPSELVLPLEKQFSDLTCDEAVDLVKDAFATAAERDIYTGDGVEIIIVKRTGITREYQPLRKD